MKKCPDCGSVVSLDARQCPICGHLFRTDFGPQQTPAWLTPTYSVDTDSTPTTPTIWAPKPWPLMTRVIVAVVGLIILACVAAPFLTKAANAYHAEQLLHTPLRASTDEVAKRAGGLQPIFVARGTRHYRVAYVTPKNYIEITFEDDRVVMVAAEDSVGRMSVVRIVGGRRRAILLDAQLQHGL